MGGKRLTIEFIRESFEKEGYTLLSTEYMGSTSKYDFICPNGHEHNIAWNMWQQGNRCLVCSKEARREKSKNKFTKALREVGYKLISEYKSSPRPVTLECNKGHEWKTTPTNFTSGNRCPKCSSRCPVTNKQNFIELVGKEGYKLLSEYERSDRRVTLECPDGHEYIVFPNHFKHKGHRCRQCSRKRIGKGFAELIDKEGYKLTSYYKGYKNHNDFECPNGHEYRTTPQNFKKGNRCRKCSIERTGKEFIELIDTEGYKLISEYKRHQDLVKLKCRCGHIYKVTPNTFKQGKGRCSECKTKNTIKEFIELIGKEGYKLISEYKDAVTHVILECSNGHEYRTTPSLFRSTPNRCPKCSGRCQEQAKELFTEYINNTDYELLDEYINSWTHVRVECPNGHIYKVTPSAFRSHTTRCRQCISFKAEKEFMELMDSEGYKLLSEYKDSIAYVILECPEGHEYRVQPSSFKCSGARCPVCSMTGISKPEIEVQDYVKSLCIDFIPNDRQTVLNQETGRYLELDLWFPEKQKAIEFNGTYWHSISQAKKRDKIKKQFCDWKGIDLLVVEEEDWSNRRKMVEEDVKAFLS